MTITWLIIVLLLVFIEASTVNLTTIWYIISGIAALISSIFTSSILIQFSIFVLFGTLLLITTRKTLLKMLKNKNEQTNLDRVINMNGIVTEKIEKNKNGEVKVDGKKWTAYSEDELDVDTIVKVLEINGVKLKVEKVEE